MSTIEPYAHPPAQADTHPVPDQGGLPAGRVQFLMFGYTRPDGTVELYASREVPWVEIEHERDLVMGYAFHERVPFGPPRITLTARLAGYVAATGADLRAALAALGDAWAP